MLSSFVNYAFKRNPLFLLTENQVSFGILSDCESSVFPSLYPTDYATMFIVYCPFRKTCNQNLFLDDQVCDSWPAIITNLVLVQAFFFWYLESVTLECITKHKFWLTKNITHDCREMLPGFWNYYLRWR